MKLFQSLLIFNGLVTGFNKFKPKGVSIIENELTIKRDQPIVFGSEFSNKHEVDHVEVSLTSGSGFQREQRDVDVGSGDDVPVIDPIEAELDGEMETAFAWDDNLGDKTSDVYSEKKNILKADLKTILEADDDIDTVTMNDCTFTEAGGERRKRNTDNTTAKASYTLAVMGRDLNATKAAAKTSISKADHTSFSSLNENSASSYVQTVKQVVAETNSTVPTVTKDVTEPKVVLSTTTKTSKTTTTVKGTTRFSSKSPDTSGSQIATAATILLCATFFL